MTNPIADHLQAALEDLKVKQQYRQLPNLQHNGRHVISEGKALLNIASNDYLGLGGDIELQTEFLNQIEQLPTAQIPKMSATSSRLLTGNDIQLQALEDELQDWYKNATDKQNISTSKSVLVLNSGYHANLGILPALTSLPVKTLILADKLVHASIIDGMRLSQSKLVTYRRYRHNDYEHLARFIEQADETVERIIVVTESIFSMDGDRADLPRLVQLKAKDARIELYVDEAHAVGILGNTGLGLAEETNTLPDIDYLVGMFGKAFASVGAYIMCDEVVKQWLINTMRPLIFSTALPPINHAWTRFILTKMPQLTDQRMHLAQLSITLSQAIDPQHRVSPTAQHISYDSPIIPYILGDNARALAKANQLQAAGFYALPIRPPTVPENTARIRLVMNAKLTHEDCERLIQQL
ncbi:MULTISPECIES: 8-amino-7-oxononanoate synthase [unclassified Psychrobacter]|uniref:8-amino-7-oxononanoate synthase n=1 Tax=unclassified Psychrobacter TaxID=196806 RepID=UPI0025B2C4FF|nr:MULTISPECIES: 8-amino-7-oxononanoate synthase [unclassified Psychrobacter]MDN3452822.1 8-amino-7-oxononanoate synthase [Psychrobacter sp. APC 3350]MDN3502757.1 8-amino-7-oxononanoate synthase [Psychrobacter sp. 5A.1]